jgi:acyl-CoA reductase-like NAD-dependent aldehyde dehydrogenase
MKFENELSQVRNKLFINGEYHSSKEGKTFSFINPCNENIISSCVAATELDVDFAVRSAKRAFDSNHWKKLDPHSRGRLLSKLADLI